ncbi:hydrolase, partial [Streptomyces sp. NPDC048484]
ATEQLQEAGISTLKPSDSPTPEAPKAPSAPAKAPPAATETQKADGAGGGGGGGGGGSEEKESKAPEKTAATAVQKLAAQDPGGRHICYRAFVTGKGWMDAVCDGQTAGTVGKETPVKAVNIAVSGTKGTAGAAFVHDPGSTNGEGHFPEPWSSAADGIDNYLGSTKKDAPNMLGFTINVDGGKGSVCQTAHVHNDAWLNQECDDPKSGFDFTYSGTHNNDLWLEAVKLTV